MADGRRPKRVRRTRAQARERRRLTSLEQAVRIEELIGWSGVSTSAILMARHFIQRGYAGRARRPKTRIPFAGDGGQE